ncbi:hypothetical protein ONE63_003482 [Megalurothrips usitatus]|uniref:Uncharacterized protein n=1 Tax=Megalurothrips usitatus TaxID=439358 RepID=A0AAV7XBE7_9NEOP|nr:hypothetical protein ONE63_003482 [Megalurothrips usitatus]
MVVRSPEPAPQDRVHEEAENSYVVVTTSERENFLKALSQNKDCSVLPDYPLYLRLSLLASAASAASVSVTDAEHFIADAEKLEADFPLTNPLAVLYLSITEAISLQLVGDPQYKDEENSMRNRKINNMDRCYAVSRSTLTFWSSPSWAFRRKCSKNGFMELLLSGIMSNSLKDSLACGQRPFSSI